jgi:hypothetical protein
MYTVPSHPVLCTKHNTGGVDLRIPKPGRESTPLIARRWDNVRFGTQRLKRRNITKECPKRNISCGTRIHFAKDTLLRCASRMKQQGSQKCRPSSYVLTLTVEGTQPIELLDIEIRRESWNRPEMYERPKTRMKYVLPSAANHSTI